ncbi:MAG TPA: hypothetical protein VJH75_03225 [Patescibacteria group bacterium]|nr:hypothetical protein [Patescibacteria group bacterium]
MSDSRRREGVVGVYNKDLRQAERITQTRSLDFKNRERFEEKVSEKCIRLGRQYEFKGARYAVVALESPRGVWLEDIDSKKRIKFSPFSPVFDNPCK